MRFLCLLLPLVLAGPAAAAQPPAAPAAPAAQPRTVEIRLSSFDFNPEVIRLRAGEPVVLRLVNDDDRGHTFSAPLFFQRARLAPGQNVPITDGTILVRDGNVVTLQLTPARGDYHLICTKLMHEEMGMEARIIVE